MMFEKLYEELIGNKERLTLFFYFADGKEHEVSELLKAWGSKDLTKYYFKSLQELGFIYILMGKLLSLLLLVKFC